MVYRQYFRSGKKFRNRISMTVEFQPMGLGRLDFGSWVVWAQRCHQLICLSNTQAHSPISPLARSPHDRSQGGSTFRQFGRSYGPTHLQKVLHGQTEA